MAVTIKGLSGLQAKLNKLDPKTRAAAAIGVKKGALLVERAAKNIVPIDDGDLRDSMHVNGKTTPYGAQARVSTNLEYAARIEFGFMGKDSLGRYYNNPAQPYLHPALQKNKRAVKKIVRDEIRRAI